MTTFRLATACNDGSSCTRVMFCVAENAPDANWIECREDAIDGLTHLYTQAGVRFYGRL